MALGGDGLMAQAVSLTWRERGGRRGDWKGEHHHLGAWCWELGGSCVLPASPHMVPLATKWEDCQVLEMDTAKEAPSSPPPHDSVWGSPLPGTLLCPLLLTPALSRRKGERRQRGTLPGSSLDFFSSHIAG